MSAWNSPANVVDKFSSSNFLCAINIQFYYGWHCSSPSVNNFFPGEQQFCSYIFCRIPMFSKFSISSSTLILSAYGTVLPLQNIDFASFCMCNVALISFTFPIPLSNKVLYFPRTEWTFVFQSVFTVETRMAVPFSTTYCRQTALYLLCSTVTSITTWCFSFSPEYVLSLFYTALGVVFIRFLGMFLRYHRHSNSMFISFNYRLLLLVKELSHLHFSLRYLSLRTNNTRHT